MTELAHSPVARALGKIPSGLFVVTTVQDERPAGFLGSFVMQAGFEPPTITVAIGRDRPHLAALRQSGRFAVSILDAASRSLMSPFLRKLSPPATPFDGLSLARTAAGSVVLSDALAWLDCKVAGEHASGDHVVVFGEVVEATLLREADPATHVRKNGLDY
jgi:3-hydroxy-9,10-secoandrosta-1,3,5(10)-triene-9,17-dione monooxygenase reductase component